MDAEKIFCPNLACPARGQVGQGNIGVHSLQEQRYHCSVCDQTFAATKGTLFYRLRTDPQIVIWVLVLLAHGCPPQAIVAAFGLDERTVRSWQQRAGQHCQGVHEHLVTGQQLDLQQVQADELRVKTQGGVFWMATALMVSTRLWLGGVVSATRDLDLITALVAQIRAMALWRPLLIAVDGLASYVTAFRRAFRFAVPRPKGMPGRPRLQLWPHLALVQVVKQRPATGLRIDRRIVQGTLAAIQRLITATQGHGGINTAYIERLNATFRERLACLARRTRALARQQTTLTSGMYLLGCLYNFCDAHDSLRVKLWLSERRYRWVPRTPALAAHLTDHIWTPAELFQFKVPPPRWTPPKRRGRPSKATRELVARWCA